MSQCGGNPKAYGSVFNDSMNQCSCRNCL